MEGEINAEPPTELQMIQFKMNAATDEVNFSIFILLTRSLSLIYDINIISFSLWKAQEECWLCVKRLF